MNINPSEVKKLVQNDTSKLPIDLQAAIELYLKRFRLLVGELPTGYVMSPNYSEDDAFARCVERLNDMQQLLTQYEETFQYLAEHTEDNIQRTAGLALMDKIKDKIKACLPANAQVNVASVAEIALILKNKVAKKQTIVTAFTEAADYLKSVINP